MFRSKIAEALDYLTDAHSMFDDLLDEVDDAQEDAENDFDNLDEVTTTIYGLDSTLFDGCTMTREAIHTVLVTARNVAEGKRDEMYDLSSELDSVITRINDAIDKADLL